MTTSHPNLSCFIAYSINDYILPDLKRLREEIRPDKDSKGLRGCTVPTAIFAFSILDLVGFLMRPDDTAKKEETHKNISYILSVSAGLFPVQYESNRKVLIELFRHGLMHQVFPKACGIAKIVSQTSNLPIIFDNQGIPTLNVDRLIDDLVLALMSIDERVKLNSDLAMRMEKRLDEMYREDSNRLKGLKTYINY